jgi:hypothetical protein
MTLTGKALLAAAGVLALSWSPASAIEALVNPQTKPGVLLGASAGVPPPGIYMFNQVFTYQANLAGPGVKSGLGGNTKVGNQDAVDVQGFLFVPGWTFLGATYDALIVQPFVMGSLGSPFNVQESGVHNTYIVPVELSWKLADSGFAIKTGLGIYVPDGTEHGFVGGGYSAIGDPYWTFQPEFIISYLKDGWNLSAAIYDEINTRNTVTQYKTGNLLHADFTVTKTIGKWTFGPVALFDAGAAVQVGLDLQPRPAAEAGAIDLQVLHDPLHVVAGLGERDLLDPVDRVDLGIARIAVAVDPFLDAAAAGIVGREGHDVGAAIILEQAAELGGAQLRRCRPDRSSSGRDRNWRRISCRHSAGVRRHLHQPVGLRRRHHRRVEGAFLPAIA